MRRAGRPRRPYPACASPRPGRRAVVLGLGAALLLGAAWPGPAAAAPIDLSSFDVRSSEEGLLLSYAVDFELTRAVEDALTKAVPLFFMAEASVFSDRWYWRDRRVAHAVRIWRIVFQPLTATYRVTFAGLSQNFATRVEAFAAITRGASWKVAEPGQLGTDGGHYLEFRFRLDTSQLPRPIQIGIGGQPDWDLSVERTQRID